MPLPEKKPSGNSDRESRDFDDGELDELQDRRKLLHEITQETRFNVIQTILMHPKQLPSMDEILFMHPEKSETTLREHLKSLIEIGIVAKKDLPKDKQSRDLPKVFYGLTDEGQDMLDDFGLLDIENTLQYLYQNMEKPDRIKEYEEAPRPVE